MWLRYMLRFEKTNNPYVLGQRFACGNFSATATYPAQHGYAARTAQLRMGLADGRTPAADHRVAGLVRSQSRFRSFVFPPAGVRLSVFAT